MANFHRRQNNHRKSYERLEGLSYGGSSKLNMDNDIQDVYTALCNYVDELNLDLKVNDILLDGDFPRFTVTNYRGTVDELLEPLKEAFSKTKYNDDIQCSPDYVKNSLTVTGKQDDSLLTAVVSQFSYGHISNDYSIDFKKQ